MKRIQLLILILLTFSSAVLAQQNPIVYGRITDKNNNPIDVIKAKLSSLKDLLYPTWKTDLYKNAFIDAHIIEYFPMNYLEYSLLLFFEGLEIAIKDSQVIIGAYDYRLDRYKLLLCQGLHPSFSNYNPEWIAALDDQTVKKEFVIVKILKSCKTAAPIIRWLDNEKKRMEGY